MRTSKRSSLPSAEAAAEEGAAEEDVRADVGRGLADEVHVPPRPASPAAGAAQACEGGAEGEDARAE
eukprot:14861582-Alexandrium_andersonii.AAC.1